MLFNLALGLFGIEADVLERQFTADSHLSVHLGDDGTDLPNSRKQCANFAQC